MECDLIYALTDTFRVLKRTAEALCICRSAPDTHPKLMKHGNDEKNSPSRVSLYQQRMY
jgi:hypothetical protein